jgi:hypothetical protein
MKASDAQFNRFRSEWPRRARAGKTRWFFVGAACLVTWVRVIAAQVPTVTIDQASQVTGVSALISGTVNANGLATWAWFRWGTTTSYSQTNFAYQLAPVDATLTFSNLLSFLSTNTTYHYQLVATNSAGQAFSPDMTLTTSAYVPTPVVTISPAINVTDDSATITGTVNPNGYPVSVEIFWVYVVTNAGIIYNMNNSQPVEELPAQNRPVPVSGTLTNLMSNTAYQCQFSVVNSINLIVDSTNITFTTLFARTATTDPAAGITVSDAILFGTLNPNGLATSYYFQWGASTAYGNMEGPVSAPVQNTPVSVSSRTLTGLSPGTIYHYQLVASNSTGVYFGGDKSFTTESTITIQGQTFTYSINNGTVTITAYAGPGGAVTIPSTIAGLPVTAIAAQVFFNLTNLTGITLPSNLADLGRYCFAYCTNLAGTVLPTGLMDLQDSVFSGCSSLMAITIPNSVTNIGTDAFGGCINLTNVVLGNGVLNIGSGAFSNCTNLTSVTIPASTRSLSMSNFNNPSEKNVFGSCSGLNAINVDPQNGFYSSLDGVLFSKDRSELFIYPHSKPGTSYAMPDSVAVIGDSAFLNCSNLTDITLGNQVTQIAHWAFLGCSGLTRLTLPDSVTNIADTAVGCFGNCVDGGVFYGCSSLTNVVVGKGLSYVGIGAFSGCSNLVGVYFKGDAPTPGTTIFYVDVFGSNPSTIVYYLPGTTGWGSSYAHFPAVLWNPQIQTGDASFGVGLNGFGLPIRGTADIPIVIEGRTSQTDGTWVSLQTCTLTNGLLYFGDKNYPNRLYRIRSP